MCRYDELSCCLLKDSELFILFAENSQILLKISVIPIFLTFIYLIANNQLNSSLRHIIVTFVIRRKKSSLRVTPVSHTQKTTNPYFDHESRLFKALKQNIKKAQLR